jgi:hypothetical protein
MVDVISGNNGILNVVAGPRTKTLARGVFGVCVRLVSGLNVENLVGLFNVDYFL